MFDIKGFKDEEVKVVTGLMEDFEVSNGERMVHQLRVGTDGGGRGSGDGPSSSG